MAYPKYTGLASPSGPLSLVGGPSHMGWLRSWPTSSIPWFDTPSSPKNTPKFVEHIRKVKLEPGEVMASYDVKALFTSVPMDPSTATVKYKLQQDPLLSPGTSISIPQIVSLLEFCLKNTYILFQGKYYKQKTTAVLSPL